MLKKKIFTIRVFLNNVVNGKPKVVFKIGYSY